PPDLLGMQTPVVEPYETADSDEEFYRSRKSSIVVRRATGDKLIAVLDIVSPGNKYAAQAVKEFVYEARELLERRTHLSIVDPFPPGPHDPGGVHAAIWKEIGDASSEPPADKPLTLVAYECAL